MGERTDREYGETGACVRFDPIDNLVWSREAEGRFTRADIKHFIIVGGCVVPVLYGNLSLCEVRSIHLQDTSPCAVH